MKKKITNNSGLLVDQLVLGSQNLRLFPERKKLHTNETINYSVDIIVSVPIAWRPRAYISWSTDGPGQNVDQSNFCWCLGPVSASYLSRRTFCFLFLEDIDRQTPVREELIRLLIVTLIKNLLGCRPHRGHRLHLGGQGHPVKRERNENKIFLFFKNVVSFGRCSNQQSFLG